MFTVRGTLAAIAAVDHGTAAGEPVDPPPAEPVEPDDGGDDGSDGGDADAVFTRPTVGTCLDQENTMLLVAGEPWQPTSCDLPHLHEVFDIIELEGGPFPGDEAVWEAGAEACLTMFPAYVGIDYDSSIYSVGPWGPEEDLWNDGDTDVYCVVGCHPEGSELIGSAYQTGQ